MIRTITLIAASILTAAAIAACGGSSKPSGGAKRPSASAAGVTFATCMRANGVPSFPDPSTGSGGGIQISASQRSGSGQTITVDGVAVNAPAFRAASAKCQKDLPSGPALTPSALTRLRAGALALAKCMRAHGDTNFPDPVISTGPGGHGVGIKVGGPGAGLDPTSPAFRAARAACGKVLGGLRATALGGAS